MSFVAQPPATGEDQPDQDDRVIINDGFFPDIDAAALRRHYRIRAVITAERLREAILNAMILAGNELAAWSDACRAQGHATLLDVPSLNLDGESRLAILYRNAIGSEAKALLIEAYRDTDLTGAGQRQVEDMDPPISELRRDRLHAIRDILGQGRAMIELL